MAYKCLFLLFEPVFLVSLDLFLGVTSFCFQIAFLSTYFFATKYDLVGTGIWAGIVFIATAAVAWTMDGKAHKLVLGAGPFLSFICGIVLFSLNIAALSDLNRVCPYKNHGSTVNIEYHCWKEIGFDVVLMLCGLIAIPVNAILVLFVFNIIKS